MDELKPKQRGNQSEKNVGLILDDLKELGLINGYRRTREYSIDDKKGIDYWVFTDFGRVPLQVKSSHKSKEGHYRNGDKSWIPCIVAREVTDNVRQVVVRLIRGYLNGGSNGNPSR